MSGLLGAGMIRIAQVLPIDSSQDAQGYTYRVPDGLIEQVQLGQLVNIPLRTDEVQGLIAHLADVEVENGAPELKAIISIADPEPIFHPGQIRAMLHYAEKHAIHIHKVVSLFFPAPIRNRIAKYGLAPSKKLHAVPSETGVVRPELVFFPKPEDAIREAAELLAVPGAVVITPSDIFTEKVLAVFAGEREKTGIFDSRMTDTGRAKFWIDALSQKYDSLI